LSFLVFTDDDITIIDAEGKKGERKRDISTLFFSQNFRFFFLFSLSIYPASQFCFT
jgi:hypothetical protein